MQVSWIDSDQIAPFLTALRNDAPPKPADVAWEWHTLPDPKPGTKSPVAEGEGGGDQAEAQPKNRLMPVWS